MKDCAPCSELYTEMLVLFWVFLVWHHGWARSFTNGQLTPAADVLAFFFLVNQNSGVLSFQSKPFSHKGSTLMWSWSLQINLAAFSVFYVKLSLQKPLCAFIAIWPHFSFTICREVLLRKKQEANVAWRTEGWTEGQRSSHGRCITNYKGISVQIPNGKAEAFAAFIKCL